MNKIKNISGNWLAIICAFCISGAACYAQKSESRLEKVSHAEPLYLDLVRDLGARKGEKELNIGAEFVTRKDYRESVVLAEYEFAPINRLGLEVEMDFSFFKKTATKSEMPDNKLECLRFSSQYSFFVSEKLQTTLAAGYTQIIELTDFKSFRKSKTITGTVYNPFIVFAKIWGGNFHTLLYTGPLIEHDFDHHNFNLSTQINTSLHYTIPQTEHFIGIEVNSEIYQRSVEVTIRPQVKIELNEKTSIGVVTGFPVSTNREGFSSFFRIIHEL